MPRPSRRSAAARPRADSTTSTSSSGSSSSSPDPSLSHDTPHATQSSARTSAPTSSLHVKSITLSGFKSYKDASVTNLSPHTNVIVGANGSGKSNLFAALEFVLGERDFSNLSHAERQELLHESSPDMAALTAYVEICFDNSDQRIPLDSDEVVLRRTIGLKKDEFFLNRKHVSKSDVANLMEAAGFSKSNPYYIVRQGRVNELCTMRDSARLQLLKEVAGTTVYDTRRRETEVLLAEAQQKRNKIQEGLDTIVQRLDELQAEKQDLEEFMRIDRDRRALTYLLCEADLAKAERELDTLEAQRMQASLAARAEADELAQMHDKIEVMEESARFAANELGLLVADHRAALDRRAGLAKARARRELDVRDAEERQRARADKETAAKEALRVVEEQIAQAEDELARLRPALEEQERAVAMAAAEAERLERRRKELEARARHVSVADRDAWLEQEAASLRAALAQQQAVVTQQGERMQALASERAQAEQALSECNTMIDENQDALGRCEAQAGKVRALRDSTSAERKEAWRVHDEAGRALREASERTKKATRELRDNLPAAVAAGLDAVERVADELKLAHKVHGPLIGLFQVEAAVYNTAVEVAAGAQLMHVVVDDDETASRLMEELLARRAGRVTFKPLNVLAQRAGQAAEDEEDDDEPAAAAGPEMELDADEAIPLVSKLQYEAKFAPAVRAAFGRTLLCRNAHVASACAKQRKVDCVTLDGDQVGRRGALTGGFHDQKRSRLAASAVIAQAQAALEDAARKAEAAKARADALDQEVAKLAGEMDKLEVTRLHLATARQALAQEKVKLQRRVRTAPALAASAGAQAVAELEAQIQALEAQRGAQVEVLSEEEKTELAGPGLAQARAELARAQDARNETRSLLVKLQHELDANLLRRRDELLSTIENANQMSSSSQRDNADDPALILVNNAHADLETAKADEADASRKVDELNEGIEARKRELADLQAELDELKDQERSLAERADASEDAVDKILDARTVAVRARELATRKIRELGSLPSTELDKHRALSADEITAGVVSATNALKRFGSVNKKALDQFVNFSEQRQTLVQRQSEAAKAHDKIRELIAHLDRVKQEAILFTFKAVSRHFREIFSALVPSGAAELRLVTPKDADDSVADAESLDDVVGVQPRVSFSGSKEPVSMQQLSGGQKALVALTLIFAIQKCDPAPFYLFDEIDQALDANHRSAVAALIQRQARQKKPTQFIVTTFRPEMVNVADKFFGIKFAHKVSTVGSIDKTQALKFVKKIAEVEANKQQEAQQDEEGVQPQPEESVAMEVEEGAAQSDMPRSSKRSRR